MPTSQMRTGTDSLVRETMIVHNAETQREGTRAREAESEIRTKKAPPRVLGLKQLKSDRRTAGERERERESEREGGGLTRCYRFKSSETANTGTTECASYKHTLGKIPVPLVITTGLRPSHPR